MDSVSHSSGARKVRSRVAPPSDLLTLLNVGRMGNVAAVRVASDKLRDMGKEDEADSVEVLAFEFEIQAVQARQLRFILDRFEPYDPNGRLTMTELRQTIDLFGMPVIPHGPTPGSGVLVLDLPTDGEAIKETADRVAAFFAHEFPDTRFVCETGNVPLTAAGRGAVNEIHAASQLRADAAHKRPRGPRRPGPGPAPATPPEG